jgi:hypothetical protein
MESITILSQSINGAWESYVCECPCAIGSAPTKLESMNRAFGAFLDITEFYQQSGGPTKQEVKEWKALIEEVKANGEKEKG